MIKPVIQKDKHNQPMKLVVEQRNGEPASLDRYLSALLKTQSLEAWRNEDQNALAEWAGKCVGQYVAGLEFKIWGYSADVDVKTLQAA